LRTVFEQLQLLTASDLRALRPPRVAAREVAAGPPISTALTAVLGFGASLSLQGLMMAIYGVAPSTALESLDHAQEVVAALEERP
jgi:hypothetical protein